MAFLTSGLDAVLGQVLRWLGLDDASQLSIGLVRELDPGDLLDLGRQLGLEPDEPADPGQLADAIWKALRAAPQGDAPAREADAHIPWGYGFDRVTGVPVDPNRLYVYWEVTDESIAKARSELGRGGEGAWLSLRIYDTSGRLFDGTNAHSYRDHEVGREDRQWFVEIGKPGSEAFVEIGMKSIEGYFRKIARSGRIEFPRSDGAPMHATDWMTVRVRPGGGMDAARTGRPAHGGAPAGGGAGVGAGRPAGGAGGEAAAAPAGGHATEGAHEGAGTTEAVELARTIGPSWAWHGAQESWSWEAGPFQYPVAVPGAVTEQFVGGRRVHCAGGRVHVVYGPWEVVIRGVGAHRERAVLSRWETWRCWVAGEGPAETVVLVGAPGSSELFAGASGRRWIAGSEARLGGASEAWYIAASELRLGGASEYAYPAASERMLRGASERMLRGASERVAKGASERMQQGASERARQGASERPQQGASEYRFPPLPPAGGDANEP